MKICTRFMSLSLRRDEPRTSLSTYTRPVATLSWGFSFPTSAFISVPTCRSQRNVIREIVPNFYHSTGNGGVGQPGEPYRGSHADDGCQQAPNGWSAHQPHIKYSGNNPVSTAIKINPNELHLNRLPQFPITALEHPFPRNHQCLDLGQLE